MLDVLSVYQTPTTNSDISFSYPLGQIDKPKVLMAPADTPEITSY